MTDKEFKRLSRAQLIDIIYKLQLELDKVNEEKQELESKLADKRLRLQSAGNIAEAALEINDCFRSAQNAADQYLNEIKVIREETVAERHRILKEAKAEAEAIVAGAKNKKTDYDSAIETILKEIRQDHSHNG
jgi:transcription termination factor NusB